MVITCHWNNLWRERLEDWVRWHPYSPRGHYDSAYLFGIFLGAHGHMHNATCTMLHAPCMQQQPPQDTADVPPPRSQICFSSHHLLLSLLSPRSKTTTSGSIPLSSSVPPEQGKVPNNPPAFGVWSGFPCPPADSTETGVAQVIRMLIRNLIDEPVPRGWMGYLINDFCSA